MLANILQYTRPPLQPKIISPKISIVPEVEKPWQDSGNVSKCLVRAERESHSGTSTSIGTLLFVFNNLCVITDMCIGGGENGNGEAQLPLGILGLDVGQGQAANQNRQQLKTSPTSPRHLGLCWSGSQNDRRGLGVTLHRKIKCICRGSSLSPVPQQVCWNCRNLHTVLARFQAHPENKHLSFQRMVEMIIIFLGWWWWGGECQKYKHFANHYVPLVCKLWVYLWDIYLLVYSSPKIII